MIGWGKRIHVIARPTEQDIARDDDRDVDDAATERDASVIRRGEPSRGQERQPHIDPAGEDDQREHRQDSGQAVPVAQQPRRHRAQDDLRGREAGRQQGIEALEVALQGDLRGDERGDKPDRQDRMQRDDPGERRGRERRRPGDRGPVPALPVPDKEAARDGERRQDHDGATLGERSPSSHQDDHLAAKERGETHAGIPADS
jgi:hypothetical protein